MSHLPPRRFLLFLIVVTALSLGSMVLHNPLIVIPIVFAVSLTVLVLLALLPRPEPRPNHNQETPR